jgi:diguanylate cyclase (GGDEF)-like protein/putative nucleotidyltransferase with HDIG domain
VERWLSQLKRGRGLKPVAALLFAGCLLPASLALAIHHASGARADLDHSLRGEVSEQVATLQNYFERARSIDLLTARNPAFRDFYEMPGSRLTKIKRGGPVITEMNEALEYLEMLYPESIGEACFIDNSGAENARVVRGDWAPVPDLSLNEKENPFFYPAFSSDVGQVHQSIPYVSPDTNEWVISNATPLPMPDGSKPAIVHFEVTIESFRKEMAETSPESIVRVVDAKSGAVIMDSRFPQEIDRELGRPGDTDFGALVDVQRRQGMLSVDGKRGAYHKVNTGSSNANEWYVVASAQAPLTIAQSVGMGPIGMIVAALVLFAIALNNFRNYQAQLRYAALNDSLTGLGNRHRLMEDLKGELEGATFLRPLVLLLLDLDGFKTYNDTFGHPAGDALLSRLGGKLRDAMKELGTAYRMGGDEFCVMARTAPEGVNELVAQATLALSEQGEGFSISASAGSVLIPHESVDVSGALRIADRRMYLHKSRRRTSASRQTKDVLLRVLYERSPELERHLMTVARLAEAVGRELNLAPEDVELLVQAAELHDVGKVAIPESMLNKPGPLSDDEWSFMKRHTLIGENILSAAPSLSSAGRLVRSSHEQFDGGGYPDALAGADIPLGARIIFVCDAFEAMTADRSYRKVKTTEQAVEDLRQNAGTQFDPAVVEAFCSVLVREPSLSRA